MSFHVAPEGSTASWVMPGNSQIEAGTLLASCYEVQRVLSDGSFGLVTKCLDTVLNTEVAVKMMKEDFSCNNYNWSALTTNEIQILEELQNLKADKCHIVTWNGWFLHKTIKCLIFELLDVNLYDYIAERNFEPLTMAEIRPVLLQLNTALQFLAYHRIIHGDINPQNIMIVDRSQQPLQVKLIDFRLACHGFKTTPKLNVQTLWYRAPEVILGLGCNVELDMWSLGLVVAELALGWPLFPGQHEYDVMKYIVDTLGQPPDYQMNAGQTTRTFFKSIYLNWRLKTPEEFAEQTGHHYEDERCFQSADELENMMYGKHQAEETEMFHFMDLIKKMLLVDKFARMHPKNMVEHPFFYVDQHTDSSSYETMKDLTADTDEPYEPQPSSSDQTSVSYNEVEVFMTPHHETVCTWSNSMSANLEDKDTAPHVQPVLVGVDLEKPIVNQRHSPQIKRVAPTQRTPEPSSNTTGRVRDFLNRIRQALPAIPGASMRHNAGGPPTQK